MPPTVDNKTDRLSGLTLATLALLHAGYPYRRIVIARGQAIGNPSVSGMHLPFGVTPPAPA